MTFYLAILKREIMELNDLLKDLNISENCTDIILLILIIAAIYNLSNTKFCPAYSPCCFYEVEEKKHKKHHKEKVEAENINNCCNNQNTFGFFNSYSSNTQDNLLFVLLILCLVFLIQKLNIDNDENLESSS